MSKIDINNLTGKCLVSMPDVSGDLARSVVYICSHSKDGAMGFVINNRIKEFSFSDLITELPLNLKDKGLHVNLYNGGPLEKSKGFILHSDDYKSNDSLNVGDGIMVSSSIDILKDIANGNGPKQRIIVLGYLGWGPNQLENEIKNNVWIITNASPNIVLSSADNDKWSTAMASLGINHNNFTANYGHS
ncbi:MAG: hypothetical protein E7020_01600 [Alphaproteobacteria bacterium]|nr:hypothetical protein [Alphaproteobacteria bacterium]